MEVSCCGGVCMVMIMAMGRCRLRCCMAHARPLTAATCCATCPVCRVATAFACPVPCVAPVAMAPLALMRSVWCPPGPTSCTSMAQADLGVWRWHAGKRTAVTRMCVLPGSICAVGGAVRRRLRRGPPLAMVATSVAIQLVWCHAPRLGFALGWRAGSCPALLCVGLCSGRCSRGVLSFRMLILQSVFYPLADGSEDARWRGVLRVMRPTCGVMCCVDPAPRLVDLQ